VIVLSKVVETTELLQTVAASVIAGIGITIVFSIAVYGATRFVDLSRDERTVAATAAIATAVLAFLVCIAAVVIAIIVMTNK
jgi:cation transporter-like permease